MTKFKSLLLVALLLISSGAMASDLIQLDSLKYCKKCVVNFPDDYIGPENSYIFVGDLWKDYYDEDSLYYKKDLNSPDVYIEDDLSLLEITDYKIIKKEYNGSILFRVLTNDNEPKRMYIPFRLRKVGYEAAIDYANLDEYSYFLDCKVQTFKEAEEKFKSVGFDDISRVNFNFTPITDYDENKLTLNMCVEAIPDKK